MRRLLAIPLILLLGLSLILPLFVPESAEATVPACCRRDGKHHCGMSNMDAQQGKSLTVIAEKCPYTPAPPAAFHFSAFAPNLDDAVFAEIVSHPAVHAQTMAQYRISFDRSRQKRGPPASFFL